MRFSLTIILAIVAGNIWGQDVTKKNLYYGNEAFTQGDYETAREYYQDAVDQSPLNFKANYNLANAHFRLNEHDKAIEKISNVINLAPTSFDKAKAYHNLGNAHMMKQDLDGAIEAYKESLKLNPSDEETRYNLAYAQALKQEQQDQDQENSEAEGGQEMGDNNNPNEGDTQENDGNDENDGNNDQNDTQEGDSGDQQSEGDNGNKPDPKDQEGLGQGYSSKLSKDQIEKILDAYYMREKELQKKLDKNKTVGYGSPKKKDW